jgi:uracil-DNA glycosylase
MVANRMLSDDEAPAAFALLAWYRAMGVDEAVGETPLDAFQIAPGAAKAERRNRLTAQAGAAPMPRQSVRPNPAPRAGTPSPEEIGKRATTLAELEALVAGFDGCPLKRTAKNLCFARGSERAGVMLIGEAPGRDEDLQGKPFVGRAGQLLDKMLAAIGLDESSVYITNTVYWRPPGNRTPSPEEIASCAPFLAHQIALLRPRLLVLLGGAAAKSMLNRSEGIMRLRGKWHSFQAPFGAIPVLATLHPAYLLRTPSDKRKAWQDLLMVKAALKG